MRTAWWGALALLVVSVPALADDDYRVRTLRGDFPTARATRVDLRLPPGAIRIEPSPDDRLRVDLDAYCSFDHSRCEERAERLSLRTHVVGNTLEFRVEGVPTVSALGLNLRGRILVPRGRSLDVDFPAGELQIRGTDGDLNVDVGAGEVSIVLRQRSVRSVRVGVGIGEASLSVDGRRIEGSGWLGHKVRWGDGTGEARVDVGLGVGELDVTLE